MVQTQVIESIGIFNKKLEKILGKTENLFLSRLIYWSRHKNNYGIKKDERRWIYNTLDDWADQLNTSKSSVRRAIKSLKEKNLIVSEYLSRNKRNRILYYAVDYDKLSEYLLSLEKGPCVQKVGACEHMVEHMDEHIYNNINKQINKSNKSEKIAEAKIQKKVSAELQQTVSQTQEHKPTENQPKPTFVQDMLQIWKEEFPSNKVFLSQPLAKFLVAALKMKFNSSLNEWRKYLKLIKTSAYIMREGFKLTLFWVIKFMTIDRLMAGDLGVKKDSVVTDESEILEKAEQHIESVDETQKCKEIRREIVKILSPEIYNTWFTHVKLVEVGSDVFMEADNAFIHDHIRWVFQDKIGLKFIEEAVDHQDIEQQKKIPEIIEATTNCVDLEEMKKHEKPEQKKSKNFISEFFCSKLKLSPEEIATQHINALPESETCKEIRRKIVKIISAEHYNLWFKYIELVENDGSVLMQEVNGVGGFAQKYISENFSPKIGLEFAGGDKRSLNNMAIAA